MLCRYCSGGGFGVQGGCLFAGGDEAAEGLEDTAVHAQPIMTFFRQLPIHHWAVQPAVIARQVGVLQVAVVVQQANLVAHVKQRQAAKSQNQAVPVSITNFLGKNGDPWNSFSGFSNHLRTDCRKIFPRSPPTARASTPHLPQDAAH